MAWVHRPGRLHVTAAGVMSSGRTDTPQLALRLSAQAESIATARAAVAKLVARTGAPGRALAEIALAVSEACTNVVVHAYRGGERGVLEVTANVCDGLLTVAVSDEGIGMGARVDSPGLGLGLPTIAALARRFEVRPGRGGSGTMLRMTFLLDTERAEAGPVHLDLI